MDVTGPYACKWFGDMHGPKPYAFKGSTPAAKQRQNNVKNGVLLIDLKIPKFHAWPNLTLKHIVFGMVPTEFPKTMF